MQFAFSVKKRRPLLKTVVVNPDFPRLQDTGMQYLYVVYWNFGDECWESRADFFDFPDSALNVISATFTEVAVIYKNNYCWVYSYFIYLIACLASVKSC